MPAPGTLTQSAQDGAGPAGRSEGGRPTHWLVPLLYEAAERIRADADDLKEAHAPDGNWAGEELAEFEHDRDIRLSARLILAAKRLEKGGAMKLTCERCLYWDNRIEEERAQGRSGFCCKALPHPEWGWALTDAEDWCGQAIPRESGSTQPVHEAAQALVEAWEAGAEADVMMQRLREALGRMKP